MKGTIRVKTVKISATEIQKTENTKTTFSGLKRAKSENYGDVYRFYPPPYDKSKYALLLELCPVKEDGKGGFCVDEDVAKPFTFNKSYREIKDQGFVEYPRTVRIANPEKSEFMGYRFRLVDKDQAREAEKRIKPKSQESPFDEIETISVIHDPGSRVNTDKGEFTVISNNMGYTPKSGSAIHIFYDSYDSNGVDRKSFVRNHFNKAGGDLDGILKYKSEIEPYDYIMTNPYIGNDSKSSHKYWGENFFQVPSAAKFKNVISELYKEGKGYIADGAFTSQSIQSPMFQNVLKYGKESPYYHWFKTNGRIKLGVLPDELMTANNRREKPINHIGFKIINPRGTKGYDPEKTSYIQFFDDRLASEEQQNDTKNLIKRYANSNPKDHFDITTHQDSVIPFYFELDYNDKSVCERFSGYSKKMLNDPEIEEDLDAFFSFKNFDITRKGCSRGVTFWDGNVDLVKMNLANPNVIAGNAEGHFDAVDYLQSVATYWTRFAKDAIMEDLAVTLSNPSESKEQFVYIAQKNGLSEQEIERAIDNYKEIAKTANSARLGIDRPIKDGIDKFRFETLDVSPQLQAVLSQPSFREIIDSASIKDSLSEYVLKTMAQLSQYVKEPIFQKPGDAESILDGGLFSYEDYKDRVNFTPYGKYMAEVLTPKIVEYAVTKAIFPKDQIYIDSKTFTIKIPDELKKRSLYEVGVMPSGRFNDESNQLKNKIYNRLEFNLRAKKQQKDFVEQFAVSDLSRCTLKGFQMAEALFNATGGGLNWRFDAAKDVADLNANRDGIRTFEDSMDDIIDFWGGFVKNVRDINPKSYIVAEVTDLGSFYYNNQNYKNEARHILGRNASETEVNKLAEAIKKDDWGKYVNPETAERMLYEKTGATTGSNYSVFFGLAPNLFGQNFEHGNVNGEFANIKSMGEKINGFLRSGPLLFITHSHIFSDNHDKPSAPFCLALDMGAYLSRFGINMSGQTSSGDAENAKKAAIHVIGKKPESYDGLSSKAMVVGDTFLRAFENQLKDDPQRLEIVRFAIKDLALGRYKERMKKDFLRAESFGQNPLDISLRDIMEQAKFVANDEEVAWFSEEEAKELENSIFKEVMAPSLQKMTKMTDFLNSVTGMPYLYAGDNLGQGGYEYATKNITVANRNLIRHEWIQKDSPDYKPEIREYYDRMQASAGLHKQYGLSAITGGMPIGIKQESDDLFALLKYDDKGSNVIQVFSNVGMTSDPHSKMDEKATKEVGSIKLSDDKDIGFFENKDFFYRKVYKKQYDTKGNYLSGKFVDETDAKGIPVKYCVVNGELRRADGKDIRINDTVTTFYKPLSNGKVSHQEIMSRFFAS